MSNGEQKRRLPEYKTHEDTVQGRNIYEKHGQAYIENGAFIESQRFIVGPHGDYYLEFGVHDGQLGVWLVNRDGTYTPYTNPI